MCMAENVNVKRGFYREGKMVIWIGVVVVVALVVFGAVSYFRAGPDSSSNGDLSASSTDNQVAAKEVKSLLAAASQLILIPDEEPTVVTITNAKEAAAQQAFYAGSLDGDKLLVFPQAQKAVIYSPSRKILVNVGPIYFNDEEAAAAEVAPEVSSSDEGE